MSDVKITAGPYEFLARWEREKSPKTCEAFKRLLPYRQKIIHVRWSGESCWIPLGDYDLGVDYLEAVPALYMKLGCAPAEGNGYPLHHRCFDVDEQVIWTGVEAISSILLESMTARVSEEVSM